MTFMIYLSIDIERWYIFPSYGMTKLIDQLPTICMSYYSWFYIVNVWQPYPSVGLMRVDLGACCSGGTPSLALKRTWKVKRYRQYLYSRAVALSRYRLIWFLVARRSFYLIDHYRQSCGAESAWIRFNLNCWIRFKIWIRIFRKLSSKFT